MTALATPTSADAWLSLAARGDQTAGGVLFHAPSHAFQAPGGGENQLAQTGRALAARGMAVRPFCPWTDRLGRARLLHLFGMSREGLELARVARALSVPVALSPISWYEPRALRALAGGPVAAACDLGKWLVKRVCPRTPGWRRELLGLAQAVLPNSQAEADQLVRLFGTDAGKIRVVPNGVEPRFGSASPERFLRLGGVPEGFVLYAGRVEPRKNVRGLVAAARDARLPLVVIGDPPPGRESYARACRALAPANTTWLPALRHDDPALASAFAAARVFALPSWFETPGLAALEAALAGRAVVVTPYGCAREYFGDRAVYARPDSPCEVARALRQAWDEGPRPGLAAHVRANFLWPEVARRTAEVYDRLTR